jgi:hypothetical protein
MGLLRTIMGWFSDKNGGQVESTVGQVNANSVESDSTPYAAFIPETSTVEPDQSVIYEAAPPQIEPIEQPSILEVGQEPILAPPTIEQTVPEPPNGHDAVSPEIVVSEPQHFGPARASKKGTRAKRRKPSKAHRPTAAS